MKLTCLAILFVSIAFGFSLRTVQASTPIILDTDIASDIDDVGALTMLNAFQQNHEASILAVIVDDANRYAPCAVQAIDTYWGHASIPVGQVKSGASNDYSRYTKYLANNFPNAFNGDGAGAEDATTLYCRTLAAADDRSVTIICIGHLVAVDALLNSSTGMQLVKQKVSQFVIMGGEYATKPNTDFSSTQAEFNFGSWKPAASSDFVRKLNTLEIPAIFIGWSAGLPIRTGDFTGALPVDDPTRAAWREYNNNAGRCSWDELATLYGVRGTSPGLSLSQGVNTIDAATGNNTFTAGAGTQFYVTKTAPDNALAAIVNELIDSVPSR